VTLISGGITKCENIENHNNFMEFLEKTNTKTIKTYTCGSNEFFKNNKEKFDIILIDGDHCYEQSKKDLENSLMSINEGGVIIIHDVKDWVQNLPREKSCARVFDEYSGKKEFIKTVNNMGVIYV